MRSLAGVPCWLFDALHVRFGGAVSQQVDLLRQIGGMPSLLEKRCGAPNWLEEGSSTIAPLPPGGISV